MSDILKAARGRYLLQLQLHPLRTKAITAGVTAGFGDIFAQKFSGVKKIQFRRLLLLMLYGVAYGGPFGHFYGKLIDNIFKEKKDGKTVAKKVLLEQLTASPWNNFLCMMYFELVVEGKPWDSVRRKVRKDYPSAQLTAWKIRLLLYSFGAIFFTLKARLTATKKP